MTNKHYPSLAAYVGALAKVLRTEYRAIQEHGFILQIDAPDLAMERHTLFADKPLGDEKRVTAGTDCGFETSAGYVMIPDKVTWAKLRVVSQFEF